MGVTLHFCSEGAAVRVLQRRTCIVCYATNVLHGRPIVRGHEPVHKPACSQLMGMTAHRAGCATPDILRMIVLGAG